MFWTIIGSSAATLTMLSFIPQIIKSYKRKSVSDISEISLFQFFGGALLWSLYGIHLKNFIIIFANIFTLMTVCILLAMYVKYGRQAK